MISWKCKSTWKKARVNTLWCLLGCSIGDFGTIFFFQNIQHDLSIVPRGYIFAAEIGLSGELRNVPKIEQRIQEASKQGFEKMVVAKTVKPINNKIQLVQLSSVKELVQHLF